MKTISSFSLNVNDYNTQQMYLPEGSEILAAEFDKEKGLVLYTIAQKPALNHNLRTFKVCKTAETIYNDNIKYINSCQTLDGIRHIFEVF